MTLAQLQSFVLVARHGSVKAAAAELGVTHRRHARSCRAGGAGPPAFVRVYVRGTAMLELWHASTLGFGRALPAALAMQRFATSAEATQAISTGRGGTSSARARPRHPSLCGAR